jgi:hypothetical protein
VSRSRLITSAVLVFAIAAFVGGQEPKKDPQPPKDPPKVDPKPADPKAPEPPKDGKRFDFKLEKDKKFYQKQYTTVQQVIKAQGQDLTQKQESTFYFEYTPVDQKDGKWFVKQRVEGLKMSIDISGNLITYDSTKPENPSTGNPGLTEFFKKLKDAEFTATIDAKTFKVDEVKGGKDFIERVAANSAQMDALLKKILTDDALKEMCDPTKNTVPDSPKKPGDTWTREATIGLGPIGSYKVTYKFTYVGPEKDMDKIDVETTLVYNAPPAPPDPKNTGPGDGLLFRIKSGTLSSVAADGKTGPGKGTILYNPAKGRFETAEVSIKLKGKLTVTIGGTDTEVELEQEQKTTVKTSETTLTKE